MNKQNQKGKIGDVAADAAQRRYTTVTSVSSAAFSVSPCKSISTFLT